MENLEWYKTVLEARRLELRHALAARDGIEVERAPDEMDNSGLALERDAATRWLERNSRLLADVVSALARLDAGDFGICLRCGEEIGLARLSSVPWTSRCRPCQEELEQSWPGSREPAFPQVDGAPEGI